MKGAPKQVEKVGCGSLPRPFSVPATLAVKPDRKWYMAWRGVSLRDRRQHAEGIGRQHDDILGMAGAAGGRWRSGMKSIG